MRRHSKDGRSRYIILSNHAVIGDDLLLIGSIKMKRKDGSEIRMLLVVNICLRFIIFGKGASITQFVPRLFLASNVK